MISHLIDGKSVESATTFEDFSPASGEVLAEVAAGGEAEIAAAVDAAKEAFPKWAGMPAKQRAKIMRRLGELIEANVSSLAAMVATHQIPAYGAGKAGVRQLTKSVAMHCAFKGYKIRCNSIHPGVIVTPMGESMFKGDEREKMKYLRSIPLKTFGEPIDIGYGVLYLISDESKFVTGAEFVIDGGASSI